MLEGAIATYSFVVVLAEVDVLTHDMAEELFESGCEDSTLSSRGGFVLVHFDRDDASLSDALGSAVKDIEKAGHKVARVEIDLAAKVMLDGPLVG